MTRRVWLALAAGLAQGSGPDRWQAIDRGLRFIYQTAREPTNFSTFREDYLFASMTLPANPRTDMIGSAAFGAYFAGKLGYPNPRLKEQIRQAAPRYLVLDYLKFDPRREPPPGDVPEDCAKCSRENPRGSTRCGRCGAALKFRSRYTGGIYGVTLGAPYAEVIRWPPAMRPYRARAESSDDEFYDTVFSITHVIYTLNDYGRRRLSPRKLPDEFAYLMGNLKEAIAMRVPEILGEFLDTLKSA